VDFKGGKKVKNRILSISLAIVLVLSVSLIGCGGEEVPEYDLTIASTEGGSVTTPGEGTLSYNEGTVVNMVAEPEEGYRFVNWTGDVGTIANVEDANTIITMNGNYTITANFALGVLIRDWYDLYAVRDNLEGNYILMNNLDSTTPGYAELASLTANEGKGWEPIVHFSGSLDGQGYEIRDLFINRPYEAFVGLFGAIGDQGVINNIVVMSVTVTGGYHVGSLIGRNYGTVSESCAAGVVTSVTSVTSNESVVGGLVGMNDGTVSNSYSTGSVSGYHQVGGLVGQNDLGTISNSYSSANVSGNEAVGGLEGRSFGIVSNSYSTGSVTGDNDVGGLVGMNDWGTISNSFSTGIVSGESHFGGLVGRNTYGSISNSFWDLETSGMEMSDGGTGKTTAEMHDIATFSGAGWNIIAVGGPSERNPAYIWNIIDGVTYPFLSWQSI
jgi:uncharacterized repeat protein (TIGR02543 family)